MAKETAAQRVERIKKEKDGLDVLENIYVYAVLGEAIDPEDIDRFKWYGLYTQNRNLQDENDETLYFMLRVKLPNGELNLEQMQAVATISKEYARNTADFTTRQDIQFHYITVRDLPAIFKKLDDVGLSTVFAA
ncbi:MAG: nitrite/sulfite reductase, partial [Arcobacteraceae bacterium]